MKMRVARYGLCLVVAGCGTAASTGNQADNASPTAQAAADPAPSANPPFVSTAVATFDSPWAMAFLPGSTQGIVTEKLGHIWLVDYRNGRKQAVSGAPRVVAGGQGGLLDVAASPTFASDNQVYLTYAEPSANGGSGLALARARLVRRCSGRFAAERDGALARPCRWAGRAVWCGCRLCARWPIVVPERRRAPAVYARPGPEPANRQNPAPDARRQAGSRQSVGRAHRDANGDGHRSAGRHPSRGSCAWPDGAMARFQPHAARDMDPWPPQLRTD